MAYQVQFPRFTSGSEKAAENIGTVNQALQMGLQVDQAQRVRKQQDWENDFRMLTAGLQMAGIKGNTPETKNKFLATSVAPIWKKWTGQDFPTLDAGNPESAQELDGLIKDVNGFGEQWAKGKLQFGDAYKLSQQRVADYHAKKASIEDVSGREKAAIDAVMAPFDKESKGGGADSPSKIKAEILRKYMSDPGSLSPQENALVKEDLVDPAFRYALTAYGQNLMNMANSPDQQLKQIQDITKVLRGFMDQQSKMPPPAPGAGVPAPAEGGAAGGGGEIPPQALKALQSSGGKPVKFGNGQTWVLENGVPKRIE